ncbi:DUF3847 domain-containing protein, partial [Dysosmobacter welbionis]
ALSLDRPTPTVASAGTETTEISMGVQRLAILHGPVNRPSADVAPARTSSQLSTLYRTDVVFRVPLCTLL